MERFEKWCDEIEYLCVDYTKRDALRRGWKAALECVRDEMLTNCYGPMDIYDFIEEELNNAC